MSGESTVNIMQGLSNIAREFSTNFRISKISIILETERQINLSDILNKLPLYYLKDREFAYTGNRAEITNFINIVLKDNEEKIYISSNNIYPIEKFVEEVDKELSNFKNYTGIGIRNYSIERIEIESFTTDNLVNSIINKEFIDEEVDVEGFEITSISKLGSTRIKYSSPFGTFKRRFRGETSLLSNRRILSNLAKVKIPVFYYHITIYGEYNYVKSKMNKFSSSANLTNVSPKISKDEVMKIIQKERLNDQDAYNIIKTLRDYEEENI